MPSSVALPGLPAEVGNRFVARLADGAVVGLVALLLTFAGLVPVEAPAGTITVGLLGYVYAAAMDATGGTLGKRLLGLSVMRGDAGRPGLGPASLRNLWLLTVLLPGVAGQLVAVLVSVVLAVTIARHPVSLGWHDRLAGTAVRART